MAMKIKGALLNWRCTVFLTPLPTCASPALPFCLQVSQFGWKSDVPLKYPDSYYWSGLYWGRCTSQYWNSGVTFSITHSNLANFRVILKLLGVFVALDKVGCKSQDFCLIIKKELISFNVFHSISYKLILNLFFTSHGTIACMSRIGPKSC